jgi:hypothetical protein
MTAGLPLSDPDGERRRNTEALLEEGLWYMGNQRPGITPDDRRAARALPKETDHG